MHEAYRQSGEAVRYSVEEVNVGYRRSPGAAGDAKSGING